MEAVLFDLDGTLLPMDQDNFVQGYFGLLCRKMAPYGFRPKALVDAIWSGTARMVANDGRESNETVFWKRFGELCGEEALSHRDVVEEFYREEFEGGRAFCGHNPKAAETVRAIRDLGYRVALATNPIFPRVATEKRIRWAGLEPEDFELITTYENIGCSKPNPAYYVEVLRRMDLKPEDCMMVGNDVEEDMVARDLGLDVFLLTDCMINSKGKDISVYPQGSFDALLTYVRAKSR